VQHTLSRDLGATRQRICASRRPASFGHAKVYRLDTQGQRPKRGDNPRPSSTVPSPLP
jgi:hypothetical protein